MSRGDVMGSPSDETNRTRKYVAGDRRIAGILRAIDGGTATLTRYGASQNAHNEIMETGRVGHQAKAARGSDGRRRTSSPGLNHDRAAGHGQAVGRQHVSAHAALLTAALRLRMCRHGRGNKHVDEQQDLQDWHGVSGALEPRTVSRQPPSAHRKISNLARIQRYPKQIR